MNTLYNRFTLDYSRQKSKDIWLPFQAMITAGQRSGQKHLASLPGPSRSTTRMKRIGSSSWSSCMSMHGERGKKSKTMTPWGPLGTSWNFVKGKWSNREVFLFHSWLKISDLNLKGCLQRRNTEVQDQCHWPVCCKDKFCSQPPTRLEKEVSRLLISSFLHHWCFDHYSQPEILWADFLGFIITISRSHPLTEGFNFLCIRRHGECDSQPVTSQKGIPMFSLLYPNPCVSESSWSAPCPWLLPPAGFLWLWWL